MHDVHTWATLGAMDVVLTFALVSLGCVLVIFVGMRLDGRLRRVERIVTMLQNDDYFAPLGLPPEALPEARRLYASGHRVALVKLVQRQRSIPAQEAMEAVRRLG